MPSYPPTKPKPVLYIPSSSSAFNEKAALADAARHGSCNSVASPHNTVISWTDTEKDVLGREMRDEEESISYPPRRQTESRDFGNTGNPPSHRSSVQRYIADDDSEHDFAPEEQYEGKALRLLLFFSAPLAILSLFALLWTIVSVIFIVLTFPIRRLVQRDTTLLGTLTVQSTSTLNLHLSCIYSERLEPSQLSLPASYLVHLTSPILAFGITLWAWIMAFYWVGSTAVGNPDGLDGRNDGGEFVLSTRRWWEHWCMVAAK